MPATPRYALYYPILADDPDVPDDMRKLAESVENAGIGWRVGDFKFSFQTADHDQFILCDGLPRTRADVPTPYATLVDSVLGVHADPTKVKTPNFHRRSPMGADPGGANINGVTPNIGQSTGEENHPLTAAESGVNGSGSAASAGTHSHPIHVGNANNTGVTNNFPSIPVIPNGRDAELFAQFDTSFGTDPAGAHTHPLAARPADTPHNTVHPVLLGNWFISTGGGGSTGGTGGGGGGGVSGVGGTVSLPAGTRTNVTHGLGTNLISITVWDVTTGEQVDADPIIVDINRISLLSAAARDVRVVMVPVTSVTL